MVSHLLQTSLQIDQLLVLEIGEGIGDNRFILIFGNAVKLAFIEVLLQVFDDLLSGVLEFMRGNSYQDQAVVEASLDEPGSLVMEQQAQIGQSDQDS